MNGLDWANSQKIISIHIAYNCLLAFLFLPFVGTLAKICERLSPNRETEEQLQLKPRYLDNKTLNTPSIALSCAMRETLHLAEILSDMADKSLDAINHHNPETIDAIIVKDDILDIIFKATKDYLIKLSREELSDNEAAKLMVIMNFATNIENAGDIISKSLMVTASKKAKNQTQFSDYGLAEIKSIHKKVMENIALAQSLFLSSDPALARTLLDHKKGLKNAEIESTENHMKRLKKGLPQTIATSGIHMDVIRDLRRVNTYISAISSLAMILRWP